MVSGNPLRVLISGGTGGVGRAIASRLARDGHTVALLHQERRAEEARAFLGELKGSGHRAFVCDLAREEAIGTLIAEIERETGGVDVCIHAAVSPIVRKNLAALSPAEFREQFTVGFFGGFALFREIIPFMRERNSGRILGITTSAIEPGKPAAAMGGYLSAKYAFRGLLRFFAQELSSTGVSVNAVAPGFMNTPLHRDLPEAAVHFLAERQPQEHRSTLAEVAGTVSFLCSPDADGITGFSFPAGAYKGTPL